MKAKLKEGLVVGKKYGGMTLLPHMVFKGTRKIKKGIVTWSARNHYYKWYYSEEMLDFIEEDTDNVK